MIEELGIKTLDDVDVDSKVVFVRVDFNSPIDPKTKKILDYSRIQIHAEKTIKELIERKARTVILAHQGRKGEPDFISLQQHAAILSKILNKDIKFVDDIFGETAKKAITNMVPGEVLLLQNVRMWDGETKKRPPEEHANSELVRNLGEYVEIFVIDAFAAAHRLHASMVGFAPVAKHTVAGRVMEAELRALIRVRYKPDHPSIYILGGAKAEDSAKITRAVLSQNIADMILTGGLVANLFLKAAGVELGEKNEAILVKKGFVKYLDDIKDLLSVYKGKIILPDDVAIDKDGSRVDIDVRELPTDYLIKDIGIKTAEKYADILSKSKTVVMNGPMGVFEEENFAKGTIKIFEGMSKSDFSLIGGGHTLAAAKLLGYIDKISFVSTGGGALVEYLSTGTLPVVEVLKKYSSK